MNIRSGFRSLVATAVLVLMAGCASSPSPDPAPEAPASGSVRGLKRALTFFAGFDSGVDAEFARGDYRLYHAASTKRPRVGQHGLPSDGSVVRVPGEGRHGAGLRFTRKSPGIVFFQAKDNLPYRTADWSGTVSFWLRVNPRAELADGFCDPIQITPRDWNDAAFFVEFEKLADRIPFRLGAYADLKAWNPRNRKWEEIPFEEKPLTTVLNPPFAGDRWTHVVFTFERFNTGQNDGMARLYLDGKLAAVLSPRLQTFTWDPAEALIMLGVSYVGYYDDLAVFDRPLSEAEVRLLHGLPNGVRSLL